MIGVTMHRATIAAARAIAGIARLQTGFVLGIAPGGFVALVGHRLFCRFIGHFVSPFIDKGQRRRSFEKQARPDEIVDIVLFMF